MKRLWCRLRGGHRWEPVSQFDAQRCGRCYLRLTALQVIENFHWSHPFGEALVGRATAIQILQGGWPKRGTGRSVWDWR